MVGDAALREIVGADAFGTVAAADQRFARLGFLRLLALASALSFSRAASTSSALRAVLVLRAVVLAFNDETRRQMGDADGGIGFVDVLAAGTRCAEGVDAQLRRIEHDFGDFVGLGHHRDGAGRGVDAALGFGDRHALHAMAAGFELEFGIRALADDAGDDFAVTAEVRRDFPK